jgi:vacuolar-type H+-ATPase subunit F/Vma7
VKVLVIGHPEAVLGFSLAGVQGRAVTTADEADAALSEALANKEMASSWSHRMLHSSSKRASKT